MMYFVSLTDNSRVELNADEYKKIASAIINGTKFLLLKKSIINVNCIIKLDMERDNYLFNTDEKKEEQELEDIKNYFKQLNQPEKFKQLN